MEVLEKNTDNFEECQKFIESNTNEFDQNDILCAIDIDNTITVTDCKYTYWPNVCKYKTEFENIKNKYKESDINIIYTNILLDNKTVILDEKIHSFLKTLKCKKIMLTNCYTGGFKNVELKEFRYNNLIKNNISIENEFKIEKHIIFNEFKPNLNNFPSFYKGILFTNGVNETADKGTVLRAFLKKIDYNPKCIILIDDNPSNHEAINREFNYDKKILNILFEGSNNYCPQEVEKEEFINFWEYYFQKK